MEKKFYVCIKVGQWVNAWGEPMTGPAKGDIVERVGDRTSRHKQGEVMYVFAEWGDQCFWSRQFRIVSNEFGTDVNA